MPLNAGSVPHKVCLTLDKIMLDGAHHSSCIMHAGSNDLFDLDCIRSDLGLGNKSTKYETVMDEWCYYKMICNNNTKLMRKFTVRYYCVFVRLFLLFII